MLRKIAFTMYPVQDAERARTFYEKTLGLTRGLSAGNGMWTEYDLPGGGCLALFGGEQAGRGSDSGASVAFEVDDLDGLNVRLKNEGVRFKEEMIDSPVCRMSVILDTEDNAIILHERKKD